MKKEELNKIVQEGLSSFKESYPDIFETFIKGVNERNDGHLFSKEFRENLNKFGHMDVTEALANKDFYKTLFMISGMTEEEAEETLKKIEKSDESEETNENEEDENFVMSLLDQLFDRFTTEEGIDYLGKFWVAMLATCPEEQKKIKEKAISKMKLSIYELENE